MPGNGAMARDIARLSGAKLGALTVRQFPDGESYVRVESDAAGKCCALICTLARPDPQIMPLILAAVALREAGAIKVELIAPYLAYLRQDRHFSRGEALSARAFAKLLSAHFDAIATIDPHLHRIERLSEIYSIPARVGSAAPLLGAWICAHVAEPFLIGPDTESSQWVATAAAAAQASHCLLNKTRMGDRSVELVWPDLSGFAGKTPVLLDDIASSGRTLIAAATGLRDRGFPKPVCVVVHALLDDASFSDLQRACARVISTDSVPHPSNGVSVAPLLTLS
jgi:ribose-phosphate pyrophosphokinase